MPGPDDTPATGAADGVDEDEARGDAATGEPAPPDRVARSGDGRITLTLSRRERKILGLLVAELRETLVGAAEGDEPGDSSPDPALARLSPPAFPDDDAASAAFRELTGPDLESDRLARLDRMTETLEAPELDEPDAAAWLGALNDLRLVLGTRLDVDEDTFAEPLADDDPDADRKLVFAYLGWLEDQFVDALASGLPDVPDDRPSRDRPGPA